MKTSKFNFTHVCRMNRSADDIISPVSRVLLGQVARLLYFTSVYLWLTLRKLSTMLGKNILWLCKKSLFLFSVAVTGSFVYKISFDDGFPLELHDIGDHKFGNDNIFFIETSGVARAKSGTLNSRQACSVESAALKNPNSSVFMVFVDVVEIEASEIIKSLRKYKNIHFLRLRLDKFTQNTPAEDFIKSRKIKQGYEVENASDLLRVLILWKSDKWQSENRLKLNSEIYFQIRRRIPRSRCNFDNSIVPSWLRKFCMQRNFNLFGTRYIKAVRWIWSCFRWFNSRVKQDNFFCNRHFRIFFPANSSEALEVTFGARMDLARSTELTKKCATFQMTRKTFPGSVMASRYWNVIVAFQLVRTKQSRFCFNLHGFIRDSNMHSLFMFGITWITMKSCWQIQLLAT